MGMASNSAAGRSPGRELAHHNFSRDFPDDLLRLARTIAQLTVDGDAGLDPLLGRA